MIETVKPTIEFRMFVTAPLITLGPSNHQYDRWASCISEGWCPLFEDGTEHRLHPCEECGEPGWLVCDANAYFRLVQPEPPRGDAS